MDSSASPWAHIEERARGQHGLITKAQLLGLGFTPSMLRTARTTRRLTSVQLGVYRVVGAPMTHEQRVLAATLRAGPSSAASHRSAGDLWGLRRDDERVEILVGARAQAKPQGATVHRSHDFEPNHFTRRRGIPVTKPARTVVDLASVLPRDELVEVVDRALVTRLVSHEGLRVMIDELARSGRRGPSTLRELLDHHPLGDVRPESVIEPVMAIILRESPVADRFVYQHDVTIGRRTFRMDFAVPPVKVGVEVLGLYEHGTRAAVIRDSERRRILRLHGWDILEYTNVEMTREPRRVAGEISRFVEDRERQFPGWSLLV